MIIVHKGVKDWRGRVLNKSATDGAFKLQLNMSNSGTGYYKDKFKVQIQEVLIHPVCMVPVKSVSLTYMLGLWSHVVAGPPFYKALPLMPTSVKGRLHLVNTTITADSEYFLVANIVSVRGLE